ncbi:MAG: hypothetical protein HY675_20435, partial [Chloroflexi bacterium]|nr:hypothetical protein [Chloroflexota bacterium]
MSIQSLWQLPAVLKVGFLVLLAALTLALLAGQGVPSVSGDNGDPGAPGADVKLNITRAVIPADRKPVITFTLTDKAGNPL